jgi:hypothetical protein
MNLDMPVVADEAELAKLVHEMTDAGSGCADHLGQRFLTDVWADRWGCLPSRSWPGEAAGEPSVSRSN